MGLFDRFKKDKEDISNPPDFSKFDDSLGDDPFADSTGLDRELGQSSQTNRQDLMNTQSQVRQQTNNNQAIIRTEPTPMKLPGSYREENNSNFNHELFNNQQQNNNSQDNIVYQEISNRQADLILERLETIKAELDAIKQRLKHMEVLVDHRDILNTQKRYL